MTARGTFGGSWNDEGLFFTIVLHAGVALFFLALIFCFNKSETLAKVLRPARPHSTGPRFGTSTDTAALLQSHENEVAMRVSVRAAVQLLFLKYRAYVFLGGLVTATALCIVCGTDSFISLYAVRKDSYDCHSRTSEGSCENVGWCLWRNVSSSSTGNFTCVPTGLGGLYDLSLLNVTPTHYRGWLLGIFNVAFHLWLAYCLIRLMAQVRVLIFQSKTTPVQISNESIKKYNHALVSRLGSRTVRIRVSEDQCRKFDGSALSLFPEYSSSSSSSSSSSPATTSFFSPTEPMQQEKSEKEGGGEKDEGDEKASSLLFEESLRRHVMNTVIVYLPPENSETGETLPELMEMEKEIIQELCELQAEFVETEKRPMKKCGTVDALEEAEERLKELHDRIAAVPQFAGAKYQVEEEKEDSKKQDGDSQEEVNNEKEKEEGEKKKEKEGEEEEEKKGIDATQAASAAAGGKQEEGKEGEKEEEEATTQKKEKKNENNNNNNNNNVKMNPIASWYSNWKVTKPVYAMITFDFSSSAAKFVQQVRAKENASEDDEAVAAISGPLSHVEYDSMIDENSGCASAQSTGKKVLVMTLYLFLLFFATSIVAFFGSIDRIMSLPGASDIFGPVVRDIPAPLFRILQAYLPVIALALFQVALPYLVRVVVVGAFRILNWEVKQTLSFRMMFVYLFVSGVVMQTALQGGLFQLAAVIVRHDLGDVLNFIISIFSPKGGYFFALVASSTTFSQLMQLFCPGNLASAIFVAPRRFAPENKTENERPRLNEMDLHAALTMLMFSIGCLFHTTSPLLAIFVAFYFVTAYYSTRAVYLDVENRSAEANKSSDTTMSNSFALAQMRYMLLLHTLATYGTFFVLNVKFLWGGAALSAATLLINAYLWSVKWSLFDTMLDTKDDLLCEHYDNLHSSLPPLVSSSSSSSSAPALVLGSRTSSVTNLYLVQQQQRQQQQQQQQKKGGDNNASPAPKNQTIASGYSSSSKLTSEDKLRFLPPFAKYKLDREIWERKKEEIKASVVAQQVAQEVKSQASFTSSKN